MTTLANFQVPLDRYSLTRLVAELEIIANALPEGELKEEKKDAPVVTEQAATTSTNTISATAGSDVELDSEGLPWDERIHSSNKQKLAKDDTWQLKRGVDKALVESVKAELRALYVGETEASENGIASVETQGLHPNPNAFNPGMVDQLAKTQDAVLNKAPPPPAASAEITTFQQLVGAMASKGIAVNDALPVFQAALGINELRELVLDQSKVPLAAQALGL